MATEERIHILIPIFNDWAVVGLLLPRIDRALSAHALTADVVLVDDGSTVPSDELACDGLDAIATVSVLALRRNLGHQRAIAVGLTYAEQHLQPSVVVVMDGDGEDDPEDIPRLVAKLHADGDRKIVFAERKRRSEPLLFRVFYKLYRVLHVILTGYAVRVGNFSAVPRAALSRLVVVSEIWNHYAAAVYNARIEYTTVPTARAKRLAGQSHMNFISLVVHGLSALSVYAHIIGVRLLVATCALVAATALGLLAMAGAVIAWGAQPPAWAPGVGAVLLVLLFQGVTAAVVFVFIMLSSRQSTSFIPLRDYALFVAGFEQKAPRP